MKKFQSDGIFDGTKFLSPDQVLICEEDGTVVEIVADNEAGDDVEILEGALCPGWINAHCHTELSHLKGKIEPKKGLVNFVQGLMSMRESVAEKSTLIQKGIEELKRNGIVAVGDICNTTDSIEAKKCSGIFFHNFVELTGFIPTTAFPRYEAAKKLQQIFTKDLNPKLNTTTLAAHSPYSVSDRLFSMINGATEDQVTSMHNQESAEENKFFESKVGDFLKLYKSLGLDIDFFEPSFQSSIQSVLGVFNARQKLLLVHNIFTSVNDLFYIKKYAAQFLESVHFVLCPKANLYIENRLPDVALFKAQKLNICIGTDSLATNNSLDILAELKVLHNSNSSVPVSELLRWGTLNGATSLDLQDQFGSFEKGKRPGINLLQGVTEFAISENAITKKLL